MSPLPAAASGRPGPLVKSGTGHLSRPGEDGRRSGRAQLTTAACSRLSRRLLLVAMETEHEERGVADEGDRDGSDGVHEEVQLWVFVPVLLQPVQHLRLVQ